MKFQFKLKASDELKFQIVHDDFAHSLSTKIILSAAACKPAFIIFASKSQAELNPMRLYIIHQCLCQSYIDKLLLTLLSAGSSSSNSDCPKISFSMNACSATPFKTSHLQSNVPSPFSETFAILLLLALRCQHL